MVELDLRYDLALIPCSSKKNPTASTAQTLYSSGLFKLMMQHAVLRADRILILSAKYGLLAPEDAVSYYDTYLPDLDRKGREELAKRVQLQLLFPATAGEGPQRVLSYLSKAYNDFLTQDVAPGFIEHWRMRRPFAGLSMFKLTEALSLEIRYFNVYPSRR